MKSPSELAPLIVADTGPLIALAKASLLELLPALFRRVCIPEAVASELRLERGSPDSVVLKEAIDNHPAFIIRKAATVPAPLADRLDPGEAEGIALALELDGVLLIDEKKGRAVAFHKSVPFIGTGRLPVAAKKRGHLVKIGPVLTTLRRNGYRLADSLVEHILSEADELP